MAEISYLPSTLLMGLFLLAIVVAVARIRSSEGTATSPTSELPVRSQPTGAETVSTETPLSWVVGFLLLVLVVGGGSILFIGNMSIPSVGTGTVGMILAVIAGGLLCGYLFSGVYLGLRSHGRKSAEATAVAIWILGLLAVGAIAANIILAK